MGGSNSVADLASAAGRKGKAMNVEEIRINKQLLKEISKRKKERINAS